MNFQRSKQADHHFIVQSSLTIIKTLYESVLIPHRISTLLQENKPYYYFLFTYTINEEFYKNIAMQTILLIKSHPLIAS